VPRIQAPTVAEQRQRQTRLILDAARSLLASSSEPLSLSAVGRQAGLPRSSVYQYFTSKDELLAAVVGDVFPDWARQVRAHIDAAETPGQRVWAYVVANIELFASSEQAIARALTSAVDPQVLQGPMDVFHAELRAPLTTALVDLGEPEPTAMAELVNGLILQVARGLDPSAGLGHTEGLALLRRLLAPYLGLVPAER
jgi:AcrR family transcriptional regulator